MTNADKIRQMSDDQLAALLDHAQFDGYRFGVGLEMPKRFGVYDWFKWLKEEAKDGST